MMKRLLNYAITMVLGLIVLVGGLILKTIYENPNPHTDTEQTSNINTKHESVQIDPPTGIAELLDVWVNQTQNLYDHQELKNTNNEYYVDVTPSITVDSNITNEYITEKGWNYYQGIDQQGKTGAATALITYDVVKYVASLDRPDFASSTIVPGQYTNAVLENNNGNTIWKKTQQSKSNNFKTNMTINNVEYNGFAFNKSHLIAWSLGGDMLPHNLIWGTRAQNVGSNYSKNPGGMSHIETLVRNYIYKNHDAKILYTAIPIYNNEKDIVPITVYVEAIDITNPNSFNCAAWTLNQQAGLSIDYTTGTAQIEE